MFRISFSSKDNKIIFTNKPVLRPRFSYVVHPHELIDSRDITRTSIQRLFLPVQRNDFFNSQVFRIAPEPTGSVLVCWYE